MLRCLIGTALLLVGVGFTLPAYSQPISGLQDISIDGSSLPAGVLSLTWDDGPTARSVDLAQYLQSEGIRATFFVVPNQHIDYCPDEANRLAQTTSLLPGIRDAGHRVGNHTYDHFGPGLPDNSPGAVDDPSLWQYHNAHDQMNLPHLLLTHAGDNGTYAGYPIVSGDDTEYFRVLAEPGSTRTPACSVRPTHGRTARSSM